jgi:TatD DNase family protein
VLVDSHCHLNYLDDLDAKLASARASGIGAFLCIGVNAATHAEVIDIATRNVDVWASAGVHPESASTESPDWVATAVRHDRVVGVGETGLDYFKIDGDEAEVRQRQRESFAAHLAIASEAKRPVIVHTRAAEADTIELLRLHTGVVGVLHCFTESWALARVALDLGWYVSISGIVTFRNADNVRRVARQIPNDRLLIETDCPWLAPVPHRGKPNQPAYMKETVAFLAELRQQNPEDLAAQTTANFGRLFDCTEQIARIGGRQRMNSSS